MMEKQYFYIRLLSALYLSTFLIRTSFGIMFVAFYQYLDVGSSAMSTFKYGILMGSSPMIELFTVLFIGAVIDTYGRKPVLLFGLGLGGFALFFIAGTKKFIILLGLNMLHGLAAACILVSSLALIADYAHRTTRGREMGAFDSINLVGWLTGFALGFAFLDCFAADIRWAFVVAGVLGLIGFGYTTLNVTEPRKEEHISEIFSLTRIIEVLSQRAVLLLTLPWFIIFLLIGAFMTFFAHGKTVLDVSGYVLGAAVFGAGLGLMATQIFYGKLSDKYGRLPLMLLGTVGFVGLMLVVGAGYFSAPPDASNTEIRDSIIRYWPLLAVFGLMALSFGPAALAALADVAHKKKRGITMGVYSVVIAGGMMVGPPVVGYLYDQYSGKGVLIFTIICALLLLMLVLIRWADVRRTKFRK